MKEGEDYLTLEPTCSHKIGGRVIALSIIEMIVTEENTVAGKKRKRAN